MEQAKGKVFIFSAPSGSGKTTIVRHVLRRYPNFAFSVSATTRKPRPHERHGVHYYFLSEEEFKQKIAAGEFLEWEEVYPGRFYGSLKSDVERLRSEGRHVLFDVDVQGGVNIKRHYGPEAVSFFIRPPSLEVLAQRLRKRGTETEEEIRLRLQKAEAELGFAPLFDYTIVNDILGDALIQVYRIIEQHLQSA
ncbi:MAG: guanylate kinase [Bacteroidetes bacterium]|nr:MAG: guanylate kinase [Bacteroidota bacterium]